MLQEVDELLVEDVVDELLLEESLDVLSSDHQCWGAALATSHAELGCRANGQCTAGFLKGKHHFKNKFCANCRAHGVFVRADRVRVLTDGFDGGNKQGAGIWTALPEHPNIGFRVINQTHKCRGPRLLVFDCVPPVLGSLEAPSDEYVIDGRWVHLRVCNGTLMPSLALEVSSAPAGWAAQGGPGESYDRAMKRARMPTPVAAASSTSVTQQHPSPVDAPTHLSADAPPHLSSLLAAHVDFGALLSGSLDTRDRLFLSDDQHAALAELLRSVHVSLALLRSSAAAPYRDPPTRDPSTGGAQSQVQLLERELLSWPPSPPGTAASGRRQTEGDGLSSTAAWGEARNAPRPPTVSTTRGPLLYLYFLILCSSAVIGQALVATLTYLFPDLCDEPHEATDPPMLAVYSLVVTVMLAGNFVVAEVVGLIPTRYADYHLCSCITRCCLYRRRRKWSRVVASEPPAQAAELIQTGGAGHTIGEGSVQQLTLATAASQSDPAGKRASSGSGAPLCAWVAWATAALAATVAATVIWVATAHASAITLLHAEAMVPVTVHGR